MKIPDEHDDDLELEVDEDAEIETFNSADDEDLKEGLPGSDVTTSVGGVDQHKTPSEITDESEGDHSDTI